jgi:uncharacterized protein (UPF0264 family)
LKLLISPKDELEALEAITGGADIIDVKNPLEGSLGANYPWVIKKIKDLTPKGIEVSCTLGDAPNIPGSFSLAAFGAASLGVEYVKVGLYGQKTLDEGIFLLQQINRAAKLANPMIKVVAAGYADAQKIGALSPSLIPEAAYRARIDIAMLDTAVKDGKTLFDNQTIEQLKEFVTSARSFKLQVALAGSLQKQDLSTVYSLGVDIVGFRGAACIGGDRNGGRITHQLVEELAGCIKGIEKGTKRA